MNVSGLCVSKNIVGKLLPRIDGIPLPLLQGGIKPFKSFQWDGFSLNEFKCLLGLFSQLDRNGCFSSISDDHLFVFNYKTDVTEMDIVSMLKIQDQHVFVDIESKNGVDRELLSKLKRQLERRKKVHMPQLLQNKPYLLAGFANGALADACFYDGKEIRESLSEDDLHDLLASATDDANVEEALYQSSSIASIVNVCDAIRKGKYSYFEETARLSEQLSDAVKDYDCAIVYGNAGTGKSVLALKAFFENPSSKLLVVNSKLYYSMGMQKEYASGKATFNSDAFVSAINRGTVSVVDECQRLSLETIEQIVSKSKFTFLFGDNKQAFDKDGFLGGPQKLANHLKNRLDVKCFVKTISKSRRYSDDVSKALNTLTSLMRKESDPQVKLPKEYKIQVLTSEAQFISEYDKADGIKKIYVPIADSCSDSLLIGGRTFLQANYMDDSFSVWRLGENRFGLTYHALSFDVDHSFVYLKNLKMVRYGEKQVFYTSSRTKPIDFDDIQVYLNELNVLFTRGRKSLVIYVDDIEAYLHLATLVNKIQ